MADTGWLSPSASVNPGGFTNPNNVLAQDDAFATKLASDGAVSGFVGGRSFGANIPSGSIINGIEVRCDWSVPQPQEPGTLEGHTWRVIYGGTNHDKTAGVPAPTIGDTDTYGVMGGPTDLWGGAPTVDQINAADFAFHVQAIESSGLGEVTLQVDHLQVKVYYTPAFGQRNAGARSGGAIFFLLGETDS